MGAGEQGGEEEEEGNAKWCPVGAADESTRSGMAGEVPTVWVITSSGSST